MPDVVRRFIALVARLAPAWARREFRAEWEAELESAWTRDAAAPRWRVAARAFGAIPDAWFLFRQHWSADMLIQDLRYAARMMRRNPGYAVLVLITLAIGIGANTAVFSVVNGVLLRPLPFKDPAALVSVFENDRVNGKPQYPVAPANYKDWADQTHTVAPLAAFVEGSMNLTGVEEPARLRSTVATARFFDVLGVPPQLGRTFVEADTVPPHHRVAVLSHRAWQQRFGGDPRVVGRRITLEGNPYEVIGVMPRGFAYPNREVDLWRPAALSPQVLQTRATHFFSMIGRLAPGTGIDQARADFEAVAVRLQREHPDTNDQRGATIVPLHDQIVGNTRAALLLLAAAVALVLLIACANVANLMLVRATGRRRELAVRTALGAGRSHLVRQLIVEGLLLATCGGAVGLLLSWWLTTTLTRVAADYVPRVTEVRLDVSVLAFVLVTSALTGVLFALAPAWLSSRDDVQDALREGARGTGSRPAARRVRGLLVVAELALAVALLVSAGLVGRSFVRVLHVDPGFDPRGVVTAWIDLPGSRYNDDAPVLQFYDRLLARVRTLPGVRVAGAVNALPLDGSGPTAWLTIEGAPRPAGEPPEVNYRDATPGYFEAMRIPLFAGRTFEATDTGEFRIALVNRTLVERFFGGRDPLGRRIRLGPNPKARWRTIVGVVGDVHQSGPDVPPAPEAYLPFAQDVSSGMSIVVRSDSDSAIDAGLASAVKEIDRDVPVSRVHTMDDLLRGYVAPRRLGMVLIGAFAAVALLLAVIGVGGVMGYTVSQRTNEFGVRMALGAERGAIVRMTLWDGVRLNLAGLAVGIAASLVASRVLQTALFVITPTDATTYAAVVGVMLVAGLLASYLPARRASRVDPLKAIRAD